ncbi:MAG: threonine synthase [Deltaproteobacteria bacterium]|nr:threonine synthase [Deltaproteobacteria bacterium]
MTTQKSFEPTRFFSTNRAAPVCGLREALLKGQAPDRGLYMPETFHPLAQEELAALKDRSYPEVAHALLRRFTAGVLDDDRLLALCRDAYNFDVPLEKVTARRYVMRLDRGPTASFKDFAARMMARWMGALMAQDGGELVILTATSGDTGSAVAHAYYRVPGVKVVVLFPTDEVSNRQRKQMTTLGENITTVAVDGKFDDCQAMVKRAFADGELAGIQLSSANSINVGRLLPQAVYYAYAWLKLADLGKREPVVFSVPSGNFGDMMGAVFARKMGVPIERLVIATNANDEVPQFLATGTYRKIEPSRVCISNAMNVGHPSNLARLVEVYGGQMDEKGELKKPADMEAMRRDLYAVSIDDAETRSTIRNAWQEHQLLLEPHGAVGWAGLTRYLAVVAPTPEPLCVSVETAHPAKFPDEIKALVGIDPPLPKSLEGIEQKTESYERMKVDYETLKVLLKQRFLRH